MLNVERKLLPLITIIMIALFMSIDVYLYIPLFAILVFMFPIRNFKISTSSVLLTLGVISYLFMFLFNYENLTLTQPFFTIFKYILLILIAFFLAGLKNTYYVISFLKFLCVFILINSYITIGYSYTLSQSEMTYVGYGILYNPIHNVYTPSPKVALQLLCSTATLCLLINKNKLLSFGIITIGIVSCLYIQSRTTFILMVVMFFVTLGGSIRLNKTNLLFAVSFLLLLLLTLFFFQDTIDSSLSGVEDTRLNKSILESKRYEHWADGLGKLVLNPFGDFQTDPNIEKVFYFHNIVFDSARIYGWASVLLLFSFFLYTLNEVINQRSLKLSLLFLFYVLIMSQDVIIEGNFNIFLIIYVFSIILNKQRVLHENET